MVVESQATSGEVTVIAEYGDLLGEGPVWNHQLGQLLSIDILRGIVHSSSEAVSVLLRVDALIGSIAFGDEADLILATSKDLMLWQRTICAYDFNAIGNRRTLIETEADSYPDVVVVDADRGLWSAAFGGAGLTSAFVTISRHTSTDSHNEEHTGALFATDLGAHGRSAAIFGEGRRA